MSCITNKSCGQRIRRKTSNPYVLVDEVCKLKIRMDFKTEQDIDFFECIQNHNF